MQQPPQQQQQQRRRHRQRLGLGLGLSAAAAAMGQGAAAFEAPATPVLSSIINPAIDRCTADPAGWVKGPVPAPESVTQVCDTVIDALAGPVDRSIPFEHFQ